MRKNFKSQMPVDFNDHGRLWMQSDRLSSWGESSRVTANRVRVNAASGNLRFVDRGKGNLISSLVAPGKHLPILDLDIPHIYVPSSTEGHGHLYLNDMLLDDLEHHAFIKSLVILGILRRGSLSQLEGINMSTVRAPGVKK